MAETPNTRKDFEGFDSLILEQPYILTDSQDITFEDFDHFARERVWYVYGPVNEAIYFKIFEDTTDASAYYFFRANMEDPKKTVVKEFGIFVNTEFYQVNGKDYSHLIPFAIMHEVHEAWLLLQPGADISKKGIEKAHLDARRIELQAMMNTNPQYVYEFIKLIEHYDYLTASSERQIIIDLFG